MIRVIIVAEHAGVRDGLRTVLGLSGSIAVSGVASSLRGALDQASHECPDVVLVDLEMPGGEGFETIRQVKLLCPRAAAVALTAHDFPSTRERAQLAGAGLVIVKGLEFTEMVAAIQAAGKPEIQLGGNCESQP